MNTRMLGGFAGVALAVASCLSTAFAEENTKSTDCPWSVSTSVGLFSDYMFRGQKLYEGTSFQPTVSVGYDFGDAGILKAGAWSQVPLESGPKSDKFTEIDYTISYDYSLDPVTLSVGHIFYTYPSDNTDLTKRTSEFFASVAADTLLTPTFTVYADYDAFNYQYYEFKFSHELEAPALGEGFNITPYVVFGFAGNADKVYHDNGLEQATLGASSKMKLGNITVTPSFHYTFKIDDTTSNEFWTGIDFAL